MIQIHFMHDLGKVFRYMQNIIHNAKIKHARKLEQQMLLKPISTSTRDHHFVIVYTLTEEMTMTLLLRS